tara:strand:- start:9676 stop:9798 length:123 start_codon:yes stop_codon:yes gene_type:complete
MKKNRIFLGVIDYFFIKNKIIGFIIILMIVMIVSLIFVLL